MSKKENLRYLNSQRKKLPLIIFATLSAIILVPFAVSSYYNIDVVSFLYPIASFPFWGDPPPDNMNTVSGILGFAELILIVILSIGVYTYLKTFTKVLD